MLIDKVRKYSDKEKYDFNCSERMLFAASDEYGLKVPEDAMKAMASFGGGMGIESICGAATGAISVIGIIFTKDRAHATPKVRELTIEFMNKFQDKLRTHNCDELKKEYKDEVKGCGHMLDTAAIILDEIIIREKGE